MPTWVLVRHKSKNEALGTVEVLAGGRFFSHGELVAAADQCRLQVRAHLDDIQKIHQKATRDARVNQQTAIEAELWTYQYFNGTPTPSLAAELHEQAAIHNHPAILKAVAGLMPDILSLKGPPPAFLDGGILFNPGDIPPVGSGPPGEGPGHRPGKPPKT